MSSDAYQYVERATFSSRLKKHLSTLERRWPGRHDTIAAWTVGSPAHRLTMAQRATRQARWALWTPSACRVSSCRTGCIHRECASATVIVKSYVSCWSKTAHKR